MNVGPYRPGSPGDRPCSISYPVMWDIFHFKQLLLPISEGNIVLFNSISFILVVYYQPFIHEGRRDVTALSPFSKGCGGYWSQSQPCIHPEKGPAHRRALIDGRGRHGRCQMHVWGSVSCSKILRHAAQFPPRGAEIQTSDLPITSRPALPTELSSTASYNFIISWSSKKCCSTT